MLSTHTNRELHMTGSTSIINSWERSVCLRDEWESRDIKNYLFDPLVLKCLY